MTMRRIDPLFQVANIATSLAFYRDLLGFNVRQTTEGENGALIHASISQGDVNLMLGTIDNEAGAGQIPPARRSGVITYITLDDDQDLDAFYDRVKAAGARVVSEPTDQFYGQREWTVIDPDGHEIVFCQPIPGFQHEHEAASEQVNDSATSAEALALATA